MVPKPSPVNQVIKTLVSFNEPSFFCLIPYDLAGSRAHACELHRADCHAPNYQGCGICEIDF